MKKETENSQGIVTDLKSTCDYSFLLQGAVKRQDLSMTTHNSPVPVSRHKQMVVSR